MDIKQTIQQEITFALVDWTRMYNSKKAELEQIERRVKELEKSMTCEHVWEEGCRGLQINTDVCSKCNWNHVY